MTAPHDEHHPPDPTRRHPPLRSGAHVIPEPSDADIAGIADRILAARRSGVLIDKPRRER